MQTSNPLRHPTPWRENIGGRARQISFRALLAALILFSFTAAALDAAAAETITIGPIQLREYQPYKPGRPDVLAGLTAQHQADAKLWAVGTKSGRPRANGSLLLGPIRVRDLTPFDLQRLDFLPSAAAADYPERWAFEANLSHTNTFILSENLADYLEAEGLSRIELDDALVQQIERDVEGDIFLFDGAVGVLNLTGHYAINEEFAVYTILPVNILHGGFLDSTIESFHDNLGFSDAGRPLVAEDQFQALTRFGGRTNVLQNAPKNISLADPVFGVRHRGINLGNWDLVLEAAVKLPIGTADDYFSSGKADIGVQASFQRKFANQGVYISVSDVYVGGSQTFGDDNVRRHIPTITAAYERVVAPRTTAIVQLTAAKSIFSGTRSNDLSTTKYQATIGVRHVRGNMHYTAAFTENMFNFNNAPDVGLHVGVGWAF
ncbi:MAG: DUF3187 family protein [Gammaproteobacteria bacterium]|nr:DUF3187 family protein [Gammaproteobacteria bacterium]